MSRPKSASTQIMEIMRQIRVATVSQIGSEVESSMDAVYVALSELVKSGGLVRVSTGRYAIPGAEAKAAATSGPVGRRGRRRANPESVRATKPAPVVGDLDLALWSTGEVMIARGEGTRLLLSAAEANNLARFLGRCGVAPA